MSERIFELWSRFVAGEPISASEEQELVEALSRQPVLRRELLRDEQLDGALRAIGQEDSEEFAQAVRDRLSAERDSTQFVNRVITGIRRVPPQRSSWIPAVLAAAAIVAVIVAAAIFPKQPPKVRKPPIEEPRPEIVKREEPKIEEPKKPEETPSPIVKPEPEPEPPPPPQVEKPKEPAIVEKPEPPKTETKVEAIGRVLSVDKATRVRGTDRAPLENGDELCPGDRIETESGSGGWPRWIRVTVQLDSGATVALADATVFEIIDAGTCRLVQGLISADVQKKARKIFFRTAFADVEVEGTRFELTADAAQARVRMEEGTVSFVNAKGRRKVTQNQESTVSQGAAPGAPRPIVSGGFQLQAREPIWIMASGPAAEFRPPMMKGKFFANGSISGEPLFVLADHRSGKLAADQNEGGWVTYSIHIPQDGEWFLWGRFYHPGGNVLNKSDDGLDNDPNSFFVRVDEGAEKVFGNLKADEKKNSMFKRWHWHGDGDIEIGKPTPLSLGRLTAGRHTIRIRDREAVETPTLRLSPRLDVLCLTRNKDYVPKDDDVRK